MDIGVIGIGNIGLGLAQRLIDRGHGVNVRDLRKVPERIAAKSGARVLPTPAAVAESCELLIIAVVDAAQVDEVLCGPGGVLSAPPVDVMICSTLAPAEVERFARLVRARGAELLDAPVSGGPAKARNGTISLMLAAVEAARTRHSAVLADLAGRTFLVSDRPGDAARVKLINNLLAGVHLVAGAAALATGERMGLDIHLLQQVISASSGQAWITDDRMPRALEGDHAPRAHMQILTKDLTLALQMLQAAGERSPFGEAALAAFRTACSSGLGEHDDGAVLELFRRRRLAPPGG